MLACYFRRISKSFKFIKDEHKITSFLVHVCSLYVYIYRQILKCLEDGLFEVVYYSII